MIREETAAVTSRQQSVRTPPRFALRIFWIAQRSIYRLSSGRIGLTRPEAGNRFGMLRLETIGRRSAKRRVAIVGYFEDGPNLVTLAMNGWGQGDPAWWLNLEANPEATVNLVDGPRAISARVASGEERERLWAKVAEYPGWGDDIDALAARRADQTAVVVLEPRSAAAEVDRSRDSATSSGSDCGTSADRRERRCRTHRPAWTSHSAAVRVADPRHRLGPSRELSGLPPGCWDRPAPRVRDRARPAAARRASTSGHADAP